MTQRTPARAPRIGAVANGTHRTPLEYYCISVSLEAFRGIPSPAAGVLHHCGISSWCRSATISRMACITVAAAGLRRRRGARHAVNSSVIDTSAGSTRNRVGSGSATNVVAGEVKGTVLPAGATQLQYTRQEPLGVIGCILPWNSPLMIAGFKIPAALAAGNTVVVKAAEDAPLSVLLLAEICDEFLPAGVLNVITGLGTGAGEALVQHAGGAWTTFRSRRHR